MILLIDNYDSFVYNLARYFQRLGQETQVVRNDAIDVSGIRALRPQAVVLSPGPCTPNEAGCSLEVAGQLSGAIPLLGVCLGHQVIGAACGGQVLRAQRPVHGRSSLIVHEGGGIFTGLPSPLRVGRYHSLVVFASELPAELEITARTEDGEVMAIQHRRHPTIGIQFHPESILTEGGYQMLANFLHLAGVPVSLVPSLADESPPSPNEPRLPILPVTF
jgi:anthranilate synthase/aminodeoxychorismate synthase-like glutamine amidotransferase